MPGPGIRVRKSDILVIPFTFVWFFVVAYQFGRMLLADGQIPIGGALLILFGFYFAIGRFFVEEMQLGGTSYGVTNQRVIIITPGELVGRFKALELRSLPEVVLVEKPDGSGTVYFGPKPGVNPPRKVIPRFDGIADVRRVYEIIRGAQLAT